MRQIQGKKSDNEKEALPLALLNNFFFLIQFSLFEAIEDLSNVIANLTSRGCSHVKALFNCDKEYAFMLKPFSYERKNSGLSDIFKNFLNWYYSQIYPA